MRAPRAIFARHTSRRLISKATAAATKNPRALQNRNYGNAAPKLWSRGSAAARLSGPEGRASGGLSAVAPSWPPRPRGGRRGLASPNRVAVLAPPLWLRPIPGGPPRAGGLPGRAAFLINCALLVVRCFRGGGGLCLRLPGSAPRGLVAAAFALSCCSACRGCGCACFGAAPSGGAVAPAGRGGPSCSVLPVFSAALGRLGFSPAAPPPLPPPLGALGGREARSEWLRPPLEWCGLLPPLSGGPPCPGSGPRCAVFAAFDSHEFVNQPLTVGCERGILGV